MIAQKKLMRYCRHAQQYPHESGSGAGQLQALMAHGRVGHHQAHYHIVDHIQQREINQQRVWIGHLQKNKYEAH